MSIDTTARVSGVTVNPILNGISYSYNTFANANAYYIRYAPNATPSSVTEKNLGNVTSGTEYNLANGGIYGNVLYDIYFFASNGSANSLVSTANIVTPISTADVYGSTSQVVTLLNAQSAELGPTGETINQNTAKLFQKINKIANDRDINGLINNVKELHRFQLRK